MSEAGLRRVVGGLALAGIGIAGYLTIAWAAGDAPVCTTGGCAKVQSSDYAELLGVPVAGLGLGAYFVLLATALRPGLGPAAIGAGIAAAGLAFSGYLLVLQLVVIEALCLWCLASDAVMLFLVGASGLRLRAATRAVPAAP